MLEKTTAHHDRHRPTATTDHHATAATTASTPRNRPYPISTS